MAHALCRRALVPQLARAFKSARPCSRTGPACACQSRVADAREASIGVSAPPPASSAPPSSGFSWSWWHFLVVPLAMAVFILIKRILKASKGSIGDLEDRGHLERDRNSNGLAPWDQDAVSKAMKSVQYTDYEPLSPDAILKARKRRERERDVSPVSLEDLELPENHPWAVSDRSDEITDDIIAQRLAQKRGVPRQDMMRPADAEDAFDAPADADVPPRSMRSRRSARAFEE